MKAIDIKNWIETKSIEDLHYLLFNEQVEKRMNEKNNSLTIAIRTLLKEKEDILIDFFEENKVEEYPSFIYYLINYFIKNNRYSLVEYFIKKKAFETNKKEKLKTMENLITKLSESTMKKAGYFIRYRNIRRIYRENYPNRYEILIAENEEYLKLDLTDNIRNF